MQAQINKILIRTPNWLGDLVMSTVFIQAVMHQYPGATVDLIVKSNFAKLPLPCRGIIHYLDGRWGNALFFRNIRQQQYEVIYVLPPSLSAAWIAFRTRIPLRIGFYGRFRKLLLNQTHIYQKTHKTQHLTAEYLQLLGNSSHKEPPKLALALTPNWVKQQTYFKPPTAYIIIAAGAKYGPAKRWPPSFYRQVVKALLVDSWSVLLVGATEDQSVVSSISFEHPHLFNLCGKTSLAELIALLYHAELLISNDSGIMHLTAALGKPQISIFGSSSPQWTAPLNPQATLLQHPVPCSPCFQKTCRFGHYNCLTQITPEQVVKKAKALLTTNAFNA